MAEKYIFDAEEEGREGAGAEPLEKALRERLRSVKNAGERRTIAGLAREIGKLPADVARAALEVSAGLASVSLRAGIDFLRAVPEAARVLDAEELRAWGEVGRRLVMADVETGAAFFTAGVEGLSEVPRGARLLLLQVCARQLSLSTSTALETYRRAPEVARAVGDAELLRQIFEVATEVARRSARHSADFIAATPEVAARLSAFREGDGSASAEGEAADGARVTRAALGLAGGVAPRRGGPAAARRRSTSWSRAARCCGSCPKSSTSGARCCAPWRRTTTLAWSRWRARARRRFARSPSRARSARGSRWSPRTSSRPRTRSRASTRRPPSPASAPPPRRCARRPSSGS